MTFDVTPSSTEEKSMLGIDMNAKAEKQQINTNYTSASHSLKNQLPATQSYDITNFTEFLLLAAHACNFEADVINVHSYTGSGLCKDIHVM